MKNAVPHRSPDLLLNPIGDGFAYAVNCSYPNSFRILNSHQYKILEAVNGQDDIEVMAKSLTLPVDKLEQFLLMLAQTEIVSFNDFHSPKKPSAPKSLNFWIHTTNACNLGCSYCYIPTLNKGKGMTQAVRQQLLYKFVEVVKTRGIRHIRLRLAGGEPLSQFGAWKTFIPEARQVLAGVNCQFDAGFVTNLTMLNDDIIAFSKEHSIGFGVSIDGVGAIHDATRSFRSGNGSFSIVDDNLRRLLAGGVKVSVNTVLTNLNLKGLPDLTRYLISLDVPFRYSIVKGENIDAELLDKYLSASYSIMQKAIEDGWHFSKRYQFCDLKPNDLGFQTCSSGFSGGAIYVDGSLKYCHVQFENNDLAAHSIFNNNIDLIDMINSGEHPEDHKSDDCKKCLYRSICTSGCPVYRVEGKDPQCSLYHRFIPKYFELKAKERVLLLFSTT